MSYSDGGYMTTWTDFLYFKPNDGEKVLIHWNGHLVDVAYYREAEDNFELCGCCVGLDRVDYWMRIPPTPEGDI